MELLPFCYYDLGQPHQSFDDAAKYKLGNQEVYAREYAKGLVLVNPSDKDVEP